MPLSPFTPTQIVIPVADRTFNDTIIKQKATFTRLTHHQSETSSSVTVDVTVSMYANDNGVYGMALSGMGFAPYHKSLGADNNTLVDAQTGEILEIKADDEPLDMWLAKAAEHEKLVMFQADFFLMLRDNAPIEIGKLITKHITDADALGRFK